MDSGQHWRTVAPQEPVRRWVTCTWAILLRDVPRNELDAVESYLIGCIFASWRCITMNRGKVEEAFGFRDGSCLDEPPTADRRERSVPEDARTVR